jgi:N5-(cytidine 5'-diphosphoramidyl)-L-glutamine hydrolase
MLRIGVSQRVTIVSEYAERRDALDQRWVEFLTSCGLVPILIPNHPPTASALVASIPVDGFLFTGGNDLAALGGDAPERDATELLLLEHALANGKPVLGVCRGMQVLQHRFGVPLHAVKGHVTQGHPIVGGASERTVNSYHNFGATESHPDLLVTARAMDGVVEAIQHVNAALRGVMWHPERCAPFDDRDIKLFREFFRNGDSSF